MTGKKHKTKEVPEQSREPQDTQIPTTEQPKQTESVQQDTICPLKDKDEANKQTDTKSQQEINKQEMQPKQQPKQVSQTLPPTMKSQEKALDQQQQVTEKTIDEPTSQIVVPPSFPNDAQKQMPTIGLTVPLKTEQETALHPPTNAPALTINEVLAAEEEATKQAKMQAQRLTEFRRKHMIFPPKQARESQIKKPLGNQIISQTVSVIRDKLHSKPQNQPHLKDIDEFNMLLNTTHSKKRENYKLFRQWDDNRGKALQWHLVVVENLIKGIDTKIKLSFQNIQIYVTFFRERANQEERYSCNPIIDTDYAFSKNQVSSGVFAGCSAALGILGDVGKSRCQKIQNFAYLIKKDILVDILEDHISKSKQSLVTIKEKIQVVRNAITETQQVLAIKTVQLPCHLDGHPNKPPENMSDYYLSQLSYLRRANQLSSMQRKLAEFTSEYYKTSKQMEVDRVQTVKRAITLYMKGLSEVETSLGYQKASEHLQKQDANLVQAMYQPSGLLDAKLQEYVKTSLGVELTQPVTLAEMDTYLGRVSFGNFDCRLLVLKEYKTVNFHKESANETCTLVITVDRFLHIFLNTEVAQDVSKPSKSFKIDDNLSVQREDSLVQIRKSQKRKGVISYILWEPPVESKFVIQFAKKDNASEFQDYINKLI